MWSPWDAWRRNEQTAAETTSGRVQPRPSYELSEISIVPGTPGIQGKELRVIEWDHMNLALFFPAALTSTWSVRTMLYPLAVLRSRLQLQKQKTVYRNTFHAFTEISKHEGFRGLYRGFWVTLPQIGCSFIYSSVYEKLRASLFQDYGMTSVAGVSSIAGGAASFATQIIFVPTDIVAQYMMVYYNADRLMKGSDRAVLEKVRSADAKLSLGVRVLKGIYSVDGVKGFYRGFWASSTVYVPSCLVFWPVYYWCQDVLHQLHPPTTGGLLFDQAVSATLSGACSTIITNPMELFRIRIQVHRTTYSETMNRIIKEEGWGMFHKGLPPRLVSNSIYSCIVMVGYEMVKRLCVLPEYKHLVQW